MSHEFRKVYLESLKGGQKKLDKDKDGKIEKSDLAKLRAEEVINEGEYEKAEENKRSAEAAKSQARPFDYHMHMADHHDNMSQWHASKGRHGEAAKHAEKSDEHHEKAMSVKESVELDEAGLKDACWKGYTAVGMKMKNGKKVPNCVPVKEEKGEKECACEEKAKCGCDKELAEATPYYNKPSFLKRMGAAAKQERLAREKKEKEAKEVKESATPDHMKGKQKPYVSSDGKGNHEVLGNTGQTKATFTRKEHGPAARAKAIAHLQKHYDAYMKEEVELEEAKKANTASARQELSQRPRKELTGADADKKKKESDDAWERLMAHAAANKKTNEEVSTKKPDPANKSDSPGFQAYLAKRRAEREKVKQATTTVKEGLGRGREDDEYHVPDPVDNRKKHTVKMKLSKDGGPVQHKQMDVHTIHGAEHAKKFAHGKAKEQGWTIHEEVELDEARVNGREYASHGLMHPDHAKMDIHKVSGQHVDFYASKTGDKMQGKVVKNDGKEVHIQAHKDKEIGDGKLHKFKVKSSLPKSQNEGLDIKKSGMGDVIKDFKKSDAPQFKGKSAAKRRQMAIAAKLEADRMKNEEVEQLDEIGDTAKGRKALGQYIKKAANDKADTAFHHGYSAYNNSNHKPYSEPMANKVHDGQEKRNKGIKRAVARLTREELKLNSFKSYMQEDLDEAAWPGTPEYKKKFPETSRGKVGDKKVGAKGTQTVTSTGVKHERDYEKAEKETGSTETQEKRGRGRPAGSKSGARN